MIVETVRAFYNSYYEAVVTEQPLIQNGQLFVTDTPGIGTELSPALLNRPDLIRRESEVKQATVGWTSGDPWKGGVGEKF